MSAAALLADLTRRGVELRAEGATVRWRAPAGVVSEADRSAIREAKGDLLAVLVSQPARAVEAMRLLDDARALEARDALAAFRLRLPANLGEVWIVVAQGVFDDLVAEEAQRAEHVRRPVIWLADWCRLKGRRPGAIRAVLEVYRAWPGSRVLQ